MAEFEIRKEDLKGLQGNVIIVTGASSGIGLATTNLLLELGALVVVGDLNPVPVEHANLAYLKTNVTSWEDQLALFEKAESLHGGIDHVFANAGVSTRVQYIEDKLDESGRPAEPDLSVIDVNLKSPLYTTVLAYHYLKKRGKGSIVITASTSAFTRFPFADYSIAKHGTLGLIRSMSMNCSLIAPSIRVNGIAPSWTATGIANEEVVVKVGLGVQGAEVPALSTALLMADDSRQGHLLYSANGKFTEIDEAILLRALESDVLDKNQPGENDILGKMFLGHLERLKSSSAPAGPVGAQ